MQDVSSVFTETPELPPEIWSPEIWPAERRTEMEVNI
jgi:hypothetical protein